MRTPGWDRGGNPGGAWPEGGGGVGGPRMGGPGGMGGPRMGAPGGMGGPGMGGPDMSGGRSRGGGPRAIKGIVLWLSAKPVLEALKTQLPEKFANHYVISLRGFPLNGGASGEGEAPGQSGSGDGSLERLKVLTLLQPKGKEGIQPDLVEQEPIKGGGSTVLFGFSKEKLPIRPEEKDVTFSTRIGRMDVKSKFNLKDMMYQGQLAI
ncbi:MAG TPA: hypothetical protein VJN43_08145 [Bryobacteraceae bacterium]|nr:hypothetical protein [Bryobacteraceae bacterium]